MGAYDYMDSDVAGLKQGLGGRVEGGWVCAESGGIPFGKPVFGYKGDAKNLYKFHKDTAKIVYSKNFVASNSTIVTVDGVATTATVYATSHADKMAAIVDKLNAIAGVEALLDPADTDVRTILIRKKGKEFTVASATTGGTGQPTATITYDSAQVFVGFSMFSQKAPGLGVSTLQGYEQYDAVNVIADGELSTEPVKGAVKANTAAYVYATAGTDFSKPGSSGSEINARWRKNAADGARSIIRVYGQKSMTYADKF